jgi:hypothetical protein
MTRQADWHCDTHADRYDCADALISFTAKFREYGLIIHDGGSSVIVISYCPWCGARLPESQRDRWFGKLERLGINPMDGRRPRRIRRRPLAAIRPLTQPAPEDLKDLLPTLRPRHGAQPAGDHDLRLEYEAIGMSPGP